MKIEQHHLYRARFAPKRTDDLAPGVSAAIGREGVFMVGYKPDEDEAFAGEWALLPFGDDARTWPFAWCPERDLEILSEES
jgi:hypothetical protein